MQGHVLWTWPHNNLYLGVEKAQRERRDPGDLPCEQQLRHVSTLAFVGRTAIHSQCCGLRPKPLDAFDAEILSCSYIAVCGVSHINRQRASVTIINTSVCHYHFWLIDLALLLNDSLWYNLQCWMGFKKQLLTCLLSNKIAIFGLTCFLCEIMLWFNPWHQLARVRNCVQLFEVLHGHTTQDPNIVIAVN